MNRTIPEPVLNAARWSLHWAGALAAILALPATLFVAVVLALNWGNLFGTTAAVIVFTAMLIVGASVLGGKWRL